jgi:hypothetical protein
MDSTGSHSFASEEQRLTVMRHRTREGRIDVRCKQGQGHEKESRNAQEIDAVDCRAGHDAGSGLREIAE